jgi:tetratricopeptide (TPR) repeat protein
LKSSKILPLLLCFAIAFPALVQAQKSAYRHYYRGAMFYGEGRYAQAEGQFQQACAQLPGNFHFTTAYGLALSRNGQYEKGSQMLQQAAGYVTPKDPEYAAKMAARHFFYGMANLYQNRAGQAVAPIKRAIALQEKFDGDERKLSIYYNALGYAAVLNQGEGSHKSAGIAPHFHVHKRDLVRAAALFEQALRYDATNAVALHNYRMLADTLNLEMSSFVVRADSVARKRLLEPVFSEMPAKIDRTLELGSFEEVLFLVDISGSMVMEKVVCLNQDRFDVMKEMALYLTERIPPSTRLGLATIGGDCEKTPMKWMAAGSISHAEMKQELRFLFPDGTTPLLTMLVKAPELLSPADSVRKSIFLVSDGENVCRVGGLDICEWAAGLAGRNITIHVLTFLDAGLENTGAFAEYTCLADHTGGKIIYIDNYRCSTELFDFNLLETCRLTLPPLQRSNCWGAAAKELWSIFPE